MMFSTCFYCSMFLFSYPSSSSSFSLSSSSFPKDRVIEEILEDGLEVQQDHWTRHHHTLPHLNHREEEDFLVETNKMSEHSDIILWEVFFCNLWSERFNTFSVGFYTVIKSSYVLGILVFVIDVSEDLQVKLFARQQLTIFGNKIWFFWTNNNIFFIPFFILQSRPSMLLT